jgi:type VI protein secretion system component VasK
MRPSAKAVWLMSFTALVSLAIIFTIFALNAPRPGIWESEAILVMLAGVLIIWLIRIVDALVQRRRNDPQYSGRSDT